MLYTRNAYYFRKFYKEEVARESGNIDLKFVASLHPNRSRKETGFAKLIYGNRDDLGKLLGTIALNVAADDQAIYELIQNADDCKSSFFSVNYNDDYLLCINNGNYFSDRDMSAIINVAGNYKDGEDIGTFGIGFKILHRLVGTDDGRDAIINDYAGPIIFSWSKFFQLNQFLHGEEIRVGFDAEKDSEKAWLVKLLYTCFPSHLGEKIRLQDYDTQDVKFSVNELDEMREFLKKSLQNINLKETNNLRNGSIFFLKLGKGKSKFLDDGIDKIKSGLSYSFKFLNSLQKIYINGEEIKAQTVTDYSSSFPINSSEFNVINPKNKNRDIKFTFAYYRDYKKAEHLRNELAPNLYTFFSMDEEKNGFCFLLHCNAFDMNNDRRKLQANSQINERLLPIIAKNIIRYIDDQKENDRSLFLSLYANLLLSKEPKSKPHINNSFFKDFQNYVIENIPTLTGYADTPKNVKVKNTFLDVSPSDFGCSEIDWFYWNNEKFDAGLISEARNSEKLNLDKWDIIDLIKYSIKQHKVDEINDWIKRIELQSMQLYEEERKFKEANKTQEVFRKPKPYYTLLSEINKNILKSNFEFIAQIRIFKFSDKNFYSLNEIFTSENVILGYEKTFEIRHELQNIGFITSIINIDSINTKGIANYANIKDLIQTKLSDIQLFHKIAAKLKVNTLRKDQKQKLFVRLQAFDGVNSEKLRDLQLFKNSQGQVSPLRKLLKGDLSVPTWLFRFKIHIAEYTPELDEYLLQEKELYKELILPHWEEITQSVTLIKPLYENVSFYFRLGENNSSFTNQNFIYLNNKDGFVSADKVYYNSKFSQITKYKAFQDAVLSLIDAQTPHEDLLPFLAKAPFKIDNQNLFDYDINDGTKLDIGGIKTLLAVCKSNNEHFFENCLIEKQENQVFNVSSKRKGTYQIRPIKEIRKFVKENLAHAFTVLPFELDEICRDEVGIVQGERLYDLILDELEVDSYKEQLVEIIHHDVPKRKFLLQLSEIRLTSEKHYHKEDFEYKILELACNPKILISEDDIDNFRKIIVIDAGDKDLKLSEIPPFTDKIIIENHELSLAKVLPDIYQNSDHLSNLINQFVKIGILRERIENLFGIKQEVELNEIFKLFSERTSILQNAEQLAFLLSYGKKFEQNIERFKVETIDDQEWELKYDYYTNHFSFIGNDYLLKKQYSNVSKIFDLPIKIGNSENHILLQPYFAENKFICPNIKSTLSDEEKVDFFNFLFNEWKLDRTLFAREVNWSKISDIEINTLLGFVPNHSVFPNQYAREKEQLPKYVSNWIGADKTKVSFLSDLGIWTEISVLIDLRKFLKGETKNFLNKRIAQEARFNDDETMLFNTFEWLKENGIELSTEDTYETFKKVVETINENRTRDELIIQETNEEKYDFKLLKEQSTEWKGSGIYTIYLFDGQMPITVRLDKVNDYIFYRYSDGDYVITENRIFINESLDKKKTLQKVASDENNSFSFEELWTLFSESSGREQELEREIEKLKQQVAQTDTATLGTDFSTHISKNDQKEANREAKEIVKEKLENEGFEFTKGLDHYSTVDGVKKDGIEYPLVVKSYKYQEDPLKIGANEWIQLMRPNSMFWVHYGNRKLGCLKLYELLKNQDKLTISFSTENLDKEDRLENFAELLHYFRNVHFDFNNVKPDNYSVANNLENYRFDERKNEQDLSSDDENIL